MIIVSQEKTEAINFDNIVRLSVSPNTSGKFLIEAHNFCDDFETVIGIYETEERAKEVLKDIVLRYEAIELCKKASPEILGYTLADYTPVYEMPEE